MAGIGQGHLVMLGHIPWEEAPPGCMGLPPLLTPTSQPTAQPASPLNMALFTRGWEMEPSFLLPPTNRNARCVSCLGSQRMLAARGDAASTHTYVYLGTLPVWPWFSIQRSTLGADLLSLFHTFWVRSLGYRAKEWAFWLRVPGHPLGGKCCMVQHENLTQMCSIVSGGKSSRRSGCFLTTVHLEWLVLMPPQHWACGKAQRRIWDACGVVWCVSRGRVLTQFT